MSTARRRAIAAALAAVVLLAAGRAAESRGPIGRGGPSAVECELARCQVAEAIEASCPCAAATSRRAYLRCVSFAAKGLTLLSALPKRCRKAVMRCARKASCGRRDRTACWTPRPKGRERCILIAPGRCWGTAETGSCCPRCPTTTTTTTTTTTLTVTTTTSGAGTTTTTFPPGATTTTTTTSTTTTSTLIGCGGLFPICLGSCPPGLVCRSDVLLGACVCTP